MKKLFRIFSIGLLIVMLSTGFQSCSYKTESDSTKTTPLTESEITETKLPKGKQVLEEQVKYANKPVDVTAMGSNKPDNTKSNSKTEAPKESRSDKLTKKYKSLLVFHADDSMEVNKPKLAVLVLARDANEEALKLEVLEESNAKDKNVKTDTTVDLGSKMKARLIPFSGSKVDFEIEPLGDDEQSFKADRKKILWQWKITPLKEGNHELKLSIQIIEKDGEAVSLPARNIPVLIYAKPVDFMSKVGTFFSTKYEWIITAVLIPVIIGIVNIKMRNKKGQNQAAP